MAKFVFRLESFFQLKTKLEDQKKQEYGQALTQLEQERQKKAALTERRRECLHSFKTKLAEHIDPESIQRHNYFLDANKRQIEAQALVIEKAEAFAEQKRLELVEAMTERKMLEKLKEHNREEFMLEENKAEQKRVDEIVSYKYNKRENES